MGPNDGLSFVWYQAIIGANGENPVVMTVLRCHAILASQVQFIPPPTQQQSYEIDDSGQHYVYYRDAADYRIYENVCISKINQHCV